MQPIEKNTIELSNLIRKYIFESQKGLDRRDNQDNCLVIVETDFILYFIFDGVGGALNGRKATELSKIYILKNYKKYFYNGNFDYSNLMFNTNIYLLTQKVSDVKTTYCSVCISYFSPNRFQYSSLGDSRIYIINPQYMLQISEDDRYQMHKNVLTKCLGMEMLEEKDFYTKEYPIMEKEQILLCSDGFYNIMESEKAIFFEVFNMKYLSSIKKKLAAIIKDKNIDDSTYILIK